MKYGRSSPEWSWRFRILKAHILASQSHSADALAILRGDLPATFASSELAVRKNMLEGMAYRLAEDFPKADAKLRTAEDLANRYQPQLLCEVFNFRGALEVDEQKYPEAEATFVRALNLARQYGRTDQEASAQVSLAWVAMKLERFDDAVDRGETALQLARSLNMQGLVATTLGNLGWSFFELGDFEGALDFYKQAADVSQKSGFTGLELYWFTGIANSFAAVRDYGSAELLSKRTLQLARQLNSPETVTECLNDLAEIYLRTGRLDLAKKYNEEALHMEEIGLDHFGVLESVLFSARIEIAEGNFQQAEKSLVRVLQDPKADAPSHWQAQARLAELHNAEGQPERTEREYRNCIDTIEKARASIGQADLRISYLSGGIEFYDDYIRFLISRHRPEDALQVAELSRARTLAEGLGAAPKTLSFPLRNFQPREIAQRTKSVLLVYWLGQKQSYLWVITPAKVTCLTLAGATEIDPLVKTYREAVLSGRDVLASGRAEGEKLYASLVAPATKFIPRNAHITLLPDGSLYGLNFETLPVPGAQPHFWIEDVTLTTGGSLTLLASGAHRTPKDQNLLLVGNAVSGSKDFPVLPQAQAEMAQVGRYFPESRRAVLAGPEATPSKFLASAPERFAYLHFVTHGSASRAHPLDSAVILSPEGETFKLYARDIVKHPLSAYLVTVSACNGSGTRAYSGEGLVGLSWAFLRAGAHNVISALWEVNDASTPQLMDKLYSELSQGRDPATALRAAKLSLLHSDSVFSKPFYWAPFQLYGGS